MTEYIQLNLFGDIFEENITEKTTKEAKDGKLGNNGGRALEKVPSPVLRGSRETGNSRTDYQRSRGTDDRGHGSAGIRPGDETQRSPGNLSAPVHSPASGTRAAGKLRAGHTDDHGNYRITHDDRIGTGGVVAKFEKNLAAVKLVKQLEAEERYAAPAEQSVLVQYTGWGGIAEVFKTDLQGAWLKRQEALKDILTEQEYVSAARSTLNAHYTDPQIARLIWDAVMRMGYTGGPTLEPAAGIGHFFGTRPALLPVVMHGIELDHISGRIAQNLYQSADIAIAPFESSRMGKDYYNLVISNVPFSNIHPYEEKRNSTPGIENGKYALHDYYFLKSLYATRPGGIVAFVTSRFTLDKLNTEVREKIAESADFLGAIRLPDNAFRQIANTAVVTDIVFLKKRDENTSPSALTEQFIHTDSIAIGEGEAAINRYFIDNPDMILGTNALTGRMHKRNEYTVTAPHEDIYSLLTTAIQKLPENVFSVTVHQEEAIKHSFGRSLENSDELPNGSYFISEYNRLFRKNPLTGEVQLSKLYVNERTNAKSITRIMQMVKMAESVRKAISHHYSEQPVKVKKELVRLNSLYDSFTAKYGFINEKRNFNLIADSPDSTLLCALEKWDLKTKTAQKAEIFSGINFVKKQQLTHVDSPVDAMALSLSRFGALNIPFMESLTGIEREQLINNLASEGKIYIDPDDYINHGRTTYITADLYLSGNIREKLRLAELAAEKEPARFDQNINALKNTLPAALGPEEIILRLNTPVVGETHVKQFLADTFDVPVHSVEVFHLPMTGKWEIGLPYYVSSTLRFQTFGTKRFKADSILNCIMNGKPVKVFDKIDENEYELNQEVTALAEQKAEEINAAFQAWVWKDQARTEDIVKRYNEVYNSHVERKYIHPERLLNEKAEIHMYGCNFPFPLRPHQADAVWRILQQNNTMLAQSVGAGKTLEMACAAMELRRLGLRSRPMIVCPDHMIGQWAADFRLAYPQAKLLIADDFNWDKKHRRTFINRIVTGDWDAVIIRAESFKKIPMSKEYQEKFFRDKIAENRLAINSIPRSERTRPSVKQLEKSLEAYRTKLKSLSDMQKDDGVIPFDWLGIDQLFIDEADLFKNLEYYTQLQNVKGLGSSKGSERALDMYMKVRHIQNTNGGVVFATGTPISNTLVEAYTMQRMLQPEVLKANGLEAFDEWARQYAEVVTQMELSNTGTGYVPVSRFSRIVNVPELVASLKQVWDIQTAQTLEQAGILVPGVNLPYMKTINEAAPATPLMKSYLKYLEERESELEGKPEKGKDNILCIMTDGRKAAIDMRLIHPDLPDDPDSKLNLAVKRIYEQYDRYREQGYTSVVFCDKARSLDQDGNVRFDVIADIKKKLSALGVNRDEIGDVRECRSYTQRQQLFNAVDEGKIRIVFGSTDTMGAGTNFQKKLKAIFHLDAPWRPRDIEQRNGRGFRPGNTTGELEVSNMVTRGSLDTGLWNVLETKAVSIQQVMNGSDKTTRQIDENYYGSVKELAVDDPLMKEVMELDHALKKLRALQRGHNNEVSNAARRLQAMPDDIAKVKERIKNVQEDMDLRLPEMTGKDFKIILDGREYTERKEAGAFIIRLAEVQMKKGSSQSGETEKVIGSYAGYPLLLITNQNYKTEYQAKLCLQARYNRYSFYLKDDPDPVGLIRSLHHTTYNEPDNALQSYERQLQDLVMHREGYEKIVDQPFTKATELKAKEERYKEVMSELAKEQKDRSRTVKNQAVMDWKNLDKMSREEIRMMVENFLAGESVVKKGLDTINREIRTSSDIARETKNRYAMHIHSYILEEIESKLKNNSITVEQVMEVIGGTVNEEKKAERVWHDAKGVYGTDNGPVNVVAMYCKEKKKNVLGDLFIAGDGECFKIYGKARNGKYKLLYKDKELASLKERAEHYCFNVALKWNIMELVNQGREHGRSREKVLAGRGYGE